jgi:UDP-N-acetylmuramoyl-tripeptide--D-alanyl-D-alanine ligase
MDIVKLHEIFLASEGISTDTRAIKKNQLFFALKGENFDGNKYADIAIKKGAAYAIVDNQDVVKGDKYILFNDVLKTLQQLAVFHRKYLNIPILGITGTNGKTTTKELINAVLQKKFKTFATQGNLNNHIGVPLTILSMDKSTEFGIIEMGANHPGEIAFLSSIAQPDYGLITNIGKAHLEGFGSFEGVKKTKNELYVYIVENNGKLFVNADDDLLMELSANIRRVLYGKSADKNEQFQIVENDIFLGIKWNKKFINTQLVGNYNFYNILAAISIGKYFNVPENKIVSAIREYAPKNNRSQFEQTADNKLIVDVYNANPVSMKLAIENFYKINAGNKLLLLGDLLELGKLSAGEHQKILDLVKTLNFPKACFIGNEFYRFSKSNYPYLFFKTADELNQYLAKEQIKEHYVLLKASRGIKLEKAIPYL